IKYTNTPMVSFHAANLPTCMGRAIFCWRFGRLFSSPRMQLIPGWPRSSYTEMISDCERRICEMRRDLNLTGLLHAGVALKQIRKSRAKLPPQRPLTHLGAIQRVRLALG